jgi:glutamyl-tRNA synthetase
MEDFVIARGDGTPVFVLANAVDDIRERITHVVRGEEHLSNAPKQQLLWQALGAALPVWAHLPVIVNERRQKLSKRRDQVALEDYLAEGYLPAALVNYLMLLGWGPRDGAEIRPYPELEAMFRLQDVSKAPAYFDTRKLAAFNGEYIRAQSVEQFIAACQRWLVRPYAPWTPDQFDAAVFRAVAGLAQTRLTVLSQITRYVDWLFLAQPPEDEASWAKAMRPGAAAILASVRANWAGADWTAEALRGGLAAAAAEHGLKLARAQAPVRVAVTGRAIGLPLFESVEVLGRERTLARLDAAAAKLAA